MKTAISLPDELFNAVERLVRRSKRPRSAVYADALREYIVRHSPDEVTDALNAVLGQISTSSEDEEFRNAAARRTLQNIEW